MDFLAAMARERLEEVRGGERRVSTSELRRRAEAAEPPRSFGDAVRRPADAPLRVIAEVKRSSPSAGALREPYDPAGLGAAYEEAGASAISVLTEPSRFGGAVEDVTRVRERVRVPILLKDFVVHERQIFEARAHGADAALLIVALLSAVQLRDYVSLMRDIGLTPLIEILERREVDVALEVEEAVIGVNNRDLRTLAMRRGFAESILPLIPADRVRVGESGYGTRADLEALERSGADAALVGESLLRAASPGEALRALLGVEPDREGRLRT
ncbi:MAG TPA: indole-3-glycerol phosphate synthase TrpC [Candidatus Eisenbacteria bacterium]|nr:indole-3-glycerol phosphate synthase TrpC [Candidatus Eisenbacteria bacterium]